MRTDGLQKNADSRWEKSFGHIFPLRDAALSVDLTVRKCTLASVGEVRLSKPPTELEHEQERKPSTYCSI